MRRLLVMGFLLVQAANQGYVVINPHNPMDQTVILPQGRDSYISIQPHNPNPSENLRIIEPLWPASPDTHGERK